MTEKKKTLFIEDESRVKRATATLNLKECRKDGQHCDVRIVVGGETFKAHRNVLAATSDYFRDLFNEEKKKEVVEMDNISPEIMRHCVESIYTGSTQISVDNVRQLWAAGILLGLHDIPVRCRNFLVKKMSGKICLVARDLAIEHKNKKLRKDAEKFGLENFDLICEQKEFLELNKEDLIFFLDSEINRFLPTTTIYNSVIRWIKHDFEERCHYFPEFLKFLNLVQIPSQFLWSTVQHEELFSRNEEAKVALDTELFRRLVNAETCECVVMLDSKKNSIIAYNFLSQKFKEIQMIENETLTGMSISFLHGHLFAFKGKIGYKLNCQCKISSWMRISDLNVGRSKIVTTTSDDSIFVVAGTLSQDDSVTGASEYYDPGEDKWTVIRDLPTPRNFHCVVWAMGHIYCIGGVDQNGEVTNNFERFDPHLGVWDLLDTKLQIPRKKAACAAYKDSIFLLGGLTMKNGKMDTIEKYSIPDNTWVLITRLQWTRRNFFAGVADGRVFACGGHDREELCSDLSVESLDLKTNTCSMEYKNSFGKLESATMADL